MNRKFKSMTRMVKCGLRSDNLDYAFVGATVIALRNSDFFCSQLPSCFAIEAVQLQLLCDALKFIAVLLVSVTKMRGAYITTTTVYNR